MKDNVSQQERLEFLARQGWNKDISEQEREAIEQEWPDHKIRMALDLNLA